MRYSLAMDDEGPVLLHDVVGCKDPCMQAGPNLYVHRFGSLAELGEYIDRVIAARRPDSFIMTGGVPPGYRSLTLEERLVVDPVYAKHLREVEARKQGAIEAAKFKYQG